MSTELLTRRMDLIHTLTQESGSSAPAVNHLTMDTSYPVKVKGIILKEYIATATLPNYPYTASQKVFDVKNQNNDVVASFTRSECFTFDGDPLDSLPAVGDYVMALIDLNANKIFISPTSDIGGGSFKEFRRTIIEDETDVLPSDADPIIDMKSINPLSFYRHIEEEGSQTKKQYPDDYYDIADTHRMVRSAMQVYTQKLKTKKGKASVLFLTQKKTDSVYDVSTTDADSATMYFVDINPSKVYLSDNIDPQPTLYCGVIDDTDNSAYNYIFPVDTNAPGTLKMYSIDLDREIEEVVNASAGTSYNLLSRAAAIQQNNCMNYSFVRNNEDLIVYQFYPYQPEHGSKGLAMAPIANVEIDDLNRLQSNVVVCAFATPNGDTGDQGSYYGHISGGYATVLSAQAIIQTIGNLSEKFRTKYSIPYSSDPASLYQSIMDEENGSNPLRLTPYSGGYFNYIDELNELPEYYLSVGCTSVGNNINYMNQSIKFIPVRDIDNYISLTSQRPINFMINGVETEINIENSDYAPFITTNWWNTGADGVKNEGFDLFINPSNDHLTIAGNGNGIFGPNNDQFVELSSTIDPFDKTNVTPTTDDRYCTVTYKMSDEIIEEIKTDTSISEEACEKVIFNFKVVHIAEDIIDIVYKFDDSGHGTTFSSNTQLDYSQGNAKFLIGTNLSTPKYTFEYEIDNFDVTPHFVNSYEDEGRNFFSVRKIRIEYPHMVNFDTKDILYERLTIFVLQEFTRAVFAANGNSSQIVRPINVVDNLGVDEMHVDEYQLFEDREFTTVVTKTMYEAYKTAAVDKTLYYYTGQDDDAHKEHGWYERSLTLHFSPASPGSVDVQENDVFYQENLVQHSWNETTNAWESTECERNKYIIRVRGARLFPYSVAQVVPSSIAFYQPSCPYPRAAKMNEFPPRPDTQYGIDFQKWFKTIDCWKLFDRNEATALNKMAMYNRGIDEKFIYTDSSKTKYRSLYDFMYDLFTKDIGNGEGKAKIDDLTRNFETINIKMSFFDATTVSAWQAPNSYSTSAMYEFNVTSDHPHDGIDTFLRDKDDPSIDYSVNEANRINVAKITTGLKKVTALSLTDENGNKLLLAGSGVDLIDADSINWKDLLLALSTNRSVDILGSVVGMKRYAKSNRKILEPNRQSTTGYAMIYNSDGTSTGMAIEGYDRYNWAKAFWSDPMMMDISAIPAYWYIDADTGTADGEVETILPVICPILGASFKGLSNIVNSYLAGDPDPVRYEVFMFKTVKQSHDATYIAFDEINTEDGLIERLASMTLTDNPIVFIAGYPARIEIDTTNHRFYIKSGFQEILNRKVFYHHVAEREEISGTIEGRKAPLAVGFFKISGHHSSSDASKVSSVFSTSDTKFSNDYADGLYYATAEEGILRSTTRVLTFRWDDTLTISGTDTGKVPIYNPSASGYAGLYTDTTIDSNDGKEFVCVFDAKGRITSMTVVGADPTF